jgi:hypothetical protein
LADVGYVEPESIQVAPPTGEVGAGMYTVVRTYSGQGASEIFDLIEQRDVKGLISGVPGFVNYVPFAVMTAA